MQHVIERTIVPLDVESIVEMDLGVRLQPERGLKAKGGVDACLFADRSTLLVDANEFDKNTPRLRFTIAHEIGHFVLHEDIYKHATFDSIDSWLNFYDELPEETHRWLEWQADEFAGRLLIDGGLLRAKFSEARNKLKGTEWYDMDPLPQPVVEAMCTQISKSFGVSDLPIFIRLREEGIWHAD